MLKSILGSPYLGNLPYKQGLGKVRVPFNTIQNSVSWRDIPGVPDVFQGLEGEN